MSARPTPQGKKPLAGRLLIVALLGAGLCLAGCSDDTTEAAGDPPASGAAAVGDGIPGEAASEDEAPEEDPLLQAPAFDVRRIRTEPSTGPAVDRPCDVAFAEDARAVEGAAASQYPPGTTSRRVLRCAAPSGGGWIEVAFTDATAAEPVTVGQRVAFRATATTRGAQGYPVVRFIRLVGDSPTSEDEAAAEGESTAEAIAPGFDFTRLRTEAAQANRPQRCAVDFVSELVLLDEPTRRRGGYPAGTQNRLSVKCLHEGGDSWVDLIFSGDTADLALTVAPGGELSLEVESADTGFAGRPMVRLARAP